jgi:hypothetical protein
MQKMVEEAPYTGQSEFLLKANGEKVVLVGNSYWINEYLSNMDSGNRYYVEVFVDYLLSKQEDKEKNRKSIIEIFLEYEGVMVVGGRMFMMYDVQGRFYYEAKPGEKREELGKKLSREKVLSAMGYELVGNVPKRKGRKPIYRPEMSEYLHGYLGNRGIYEYTAVIALFGKQVMSEAHLDKIRTFYVSKQLKDYFTKFLGVRDDKGNLVPFDVLVGQAYENCEEIANLMYLNLDIDIDVIYKPSAALKNLRMVLYEEADRQSKSRFKAGDRQKEYKELLRERQKEASVRFVGDSLVYRSSNNVEFSIKVTKLNKPEATGWFTKLVLFFEKDTNPNISAIRNTRFSTNTGYDILKLTMQVRMIDDWYLSYTERNSGGSRKILLTYFTTEGDKRVVNYVSGMDLATINKQLIA